MVDGVSNNKGDDFNINPKGGPSQTASKGKSICIWLDAHGNNDGYITTDDLVIIEKSDIWKTFSDNVKKIISSAVVLYTTQNKEHERYVDSIRVQYKTLEKFSVEDASAINLPDNYGKTVKIDGDEKIVSELISLEGNRVIEKITRYNAKTDGIISIEEKTTDIISNNTKNELIVYSDPATGKKIRSLNRTVTENKDGSTSVSTSIEQLAGNGKSVNKIDAKYTYSRENIENYIIKYAKDFGSGQKLFDDVQDLKTKDISELTNDEKGKLAKFDKLVDTIIQSGLDYGIDPNFITAIIRQETGFDGDNQKKCFGKNGQGYMQLTRAPIQDFLGAATLPGKGCPDGKWLSNKTEQFGYEFRELLISRGFNPDGAKTAKEKHKLTEDIFKYLHSSPGNQDMEFNIRMGTLVLRYNANRQNGNISKTARAYNGSPEHRDKYAANVSEYFKALANLYANNTTYKKYASLYENSTLNA